MYSPKLRQPARAARRSGFFVARAPCLSLKIRKDASRRPPPRGQTRCNRWLQETVVGWVPIVVGLLFTMNAATSTCPRGIGLEPRRAIAAYGASRTWRQAAGRSAILSPGLGFDGGDGLGWSTASVNQ